VSDESPGSSPPRWIATRQVSRSGAGARNGAPGPPRWTPAPGRRFSRALGLALAAPLAVVAALALAAVAALALARFAGPARPEGERTGDELCAVGAAGGTRNLSLARSAAIGRARTALARALAGGEGAGEVEAILARAETRATWLSGDGTAHARVVLNDPGGSGGRRGESGRECAGAGD
jgi:hypothetical protein